MIHERFCINTGYIFIDIIIHISLQCIIVIYRVEFKLDVDIVNKCPIHARTLKVGGGVVFVALSMRTWSTSPSLSPYTNHILSQSSKSKSVWLCPWYVYFYYSHGSMRTRKIIRYRRIILTISMHILIISLFKITSAIK